MPKKITAYHDGVEKTLSLSGWSLITGFSPPRILYRSKVSELRGFTSEMVVGLDCTDSLNAIDYSRDSKMCTSYLMGKTLIQIGDEHRISRQRVQQILSRHGITKADSPNEVRRELAKSIKEKNKCGRYLVSYGCTVKERDNFISWHGFEPLLRYREQRGNAGARKIKWDISFSEWWDIWFSSGKWDKRGTKKGYFVMARYEDKGPYTKDNVYITTASSNISDGYLFRSKKRG